MTEIVTTEHCFNFHDGKHKDRTNRYVFDYPEIWYTNQTIKDMTMGVRSIILKPEPITVNLNNVFVVGINSAVTETLTGMTTIPVINSQIVLPNRMTVDIRCNVDEKMDILTFVNWANNKYVKDYEHFKDIVFNLFIDGGILDISRYSLYWEYDKNGNFSMKANGQSMIAVRMYYTGKEQADFECNAFNEGFHELVGLDITNEDTCINMYLALIAKYLNQKTAGAEKRLDAVLEKARQNGIDIDTPTLSLDSLNKPYVFWDLKFNSITFSNVWSRKDVLLTSSLAEMDKRGYLGFSSNYSNSAQAIYPQPKMFDINNTESKFWVDLYDSYTQKSIQMLGGNLLLIEAVVVQKPKRTFNRN